MKMLHTHIILTIMAFLATNVYFVLGLLIDGNPGQKVITDGLSFYDFFWISNGALLIIAMSSIYFEDFGDRLLAWGYSNLFRFFSLIFLSLVIFIGAFAILLLVHYALKNVAHLTEAVSKALATKYFISLVFHFSLVSMLMFFISNLERRSGSVFRLMAQSMGRTLRPKLVDRGFMFIDLNSATAIAEKLDSRSYANLLRDCFRMLNELVALSPFEVYQYVGDEAVITWPAETPNADILALHLFSDFKAYLKENGTKFRIAYGLTPLFKCAIHSGTVVQSEIGKEVKHLVYHGDVLNTAARLLSQCHYNRADMIVSEQAVNNGERIRESYVLEPMRYAHLKGKENAVRAYVVSEKQKRASRSRLKSGLFSVIKVTNSQKLLINKNSMKTIKNGLRSTLAALLFAACGGEKKKAPETSENVPKETASASHSNVQIVRKSDLELRTIQNTTVSSFLPITGRVAPGNTTQLVSEVQGRIVTANRPFKAGTSYRKGEIILQMDSQEFALNLESRKSAFLNILTGMMPDMKADYPENYQQWLNYVDSYETGKPLPALPETRSNPEKYFLTSRQVYNTYYNIKAQEERLGKFTLTAPYSGSLSVASVDHGSLVSPGQPLGTFISDTEYEIESAVPLKLAKALKVGQQIEFYNKDLDKRFMAKVMRINNIVDPGTQNIPVFLRIADSDLRSGMYLEGQVPSSTFEDAVNVPNYAVNRDNTVHILENGVIRKEVVDVLNATDKEVVIRGLKDNTQLVLTTFDNPVSGLKIIE